MNAPALPRNPLAALIQPEYMDAAREREFVEQCRRAFHESGFLGVYQNDPRLTPIERQVVAAIGNRLYRERGNHGRA